MSNKGKTRKRTDFSRNEVSNQGKVPRIIGPNRGPRGSIKAIANLKPDDLVDMPTRRWSRLVSAPFTAPFEGVYMPLAEDNFPCASTKVKAYGAQELDAAAGDVIFRVWFFPSGLPLIGEHDATAYRPISLTGAVKAYLGMAVNHATLGPSIAGVYEHSSSTGMDYDPTFSLCSGLYFDSQLYPMVITDTSTSITTPTHIRTIAFGVRVSFVGALVDTEGWVEFWNPPEMPEKASATSVEAMRSDASYRRKFFGAKRSHEFVWHPNCDSVQYKDVVGSTAANPTTGGSRMFLRIGGMEEGDKFLIEYVTHQEMTDNRITSIYTPVTVTPDAAHVANAIVAGHGRLNRDIDNQKVTIAQSTAASKVVHHPKAPSLRVGDESVLSQLAGGANEVGKLVKAFGGLASAIA